jgi:hypothetical protein
MAKEVKVKAGMAYTKSGVKKISGTATTTKVATTKKPKINSNMTSSTGSSKPKKSVAGNMAGTSPKLSRKMNALDAAISKGKTLPSKNSKYPGDTDVKMKGIKAKPVIKLKKK